MVTTEGVPRGLRSTGGVGVRPFFKTCWGHALAAAQRPCLAFTSARSAKVLCDTRHRGQRLRKIHVPQDCRPKASGTPAPRQGPAHRIGSSALSAPSPSTPGGCRWCGCSCESWPPRGERRARPRRVQPGAPARVSARSLAEGQRWAQATRRVSIRCAPTAGQRSTAQARAGCGVLDWRSLKCRNSEAPHGACQPPWSSLSNTIETRLIDGPNSTVHVCRSFDLRHAQATSYVTCTLAACTCAPHQAWLAQHPAGLFPEGCCAVPSFARLLAPSSAPFACPRQTHDGAHGTAAGAGLLPTLQSRSAANR